MFFSLFFPLVFMVAFGFIGGQEPDPVRLGIVNNASGPLADELIGKSSCAPSWRKATASSYWSSRRNSATGMARLI